MFLISLKVGGIGEDKPVFVHKLQQEKAKLADGLLADADIVRKLDATMIRELLG